MIDILIFLIWGIEGAMLYVNIMVKSSDILKTPSQSFFPNNMVGRRVEEGGEDYCCRLPKTPEQLKLIRPLQYEIVTYNLRQSLEQN